MNIWVERLTAPSLVYLLFRTKASDRIWIDPHNVSRTAKVMLASGKATRMVRLNIGERFQEASVELGVKDENGKALNYRFEADLENVAVSFTSKYMKMGTRSHRKMVEAYIASALFYRITYMTMASFSVAKANSCVDAFYLERHPLNTLVKKHYRTAGVETKFIQSLSFKAHARAILAPLYLLTASIYFKIIKRPVKSNVVNVRPSIWLEHEGLDVIKCTSLTFWRRYLETDDFDAVSYIDRPGSDVSAEVQEDCMRQGFFWIDLRNICMVSQLGLWDIIKGALRFPLLFIRAPWWYAFFDLERGFLTAIYRRVYSKYKVKILIQHQEFSWRQAVQRDALDLAGGIMIGAHWSNYPYITEPAHLTPQHVFFVWGEAYRSWALQAGATADHILPCGIWVQKDNDKNTAVGMPSVAPKYSLAIFDSSISYNIYNSPESLSQFYIALFEYLDARPDRTAVIKSKNFDAVALSGLPQGDKVTDFVSRLTSQGRLALLDKAVSPVSAASEAQLSVCYSLNSAGIIVAALGGRAVHWDNCGWLDNPLYKESDQKFLYTELEAMLADVDKALNGDQSIGELGELAKMFNTFSDEYAPDRVAGFIGNYMRSVVGGSTAAESLKQTVSEYEMQHKLSNELWNKRDLWVADVSGKRMSDERLDKAALRESVSN